MISFQNEGKPFVRKVSSVQIAQRFNTISSFLSANTNVLMSEEEAAEMQPNPEVCCMPSRGSSTQLDEGTDGLVPNCP